MRRDNIHCLSRLGCAQVKQLSRQQSSITQQVVTVLNFCTTAFVYLALIFQLLLQGGFSPHAPTILVIPLATLQGLKVSTVIGNRSCNVAPTMLNAVVHCAHICNHFAKQLD